MTKSTATKSDTPSDRLTHLCNDMLATFNQHPEKRPDDRAIVFLVDEVKGGIGIGGYENEADALVDLMVHVRVIFQARGVELHFVPVGTTPPKDRA